MNSRPLLFTLALTVGLLTGCVTHINTNVTQNPPPAEKLSDFTRFELQPVALPKPYTGQAANEKAVKKIQENISARMNPMLGDWMSAVPDGAPARTLEIEPVISQIKFINATSRVWAGAMAGSSAVVLKVKLIDKEHGKVIGEPVFYARAAAMGGAWSFGSTDNLMLTRVANRMTDYLIANYLKAVGGPSGATPPSPKA